MQEQQIQLLITMDQKGQVLVQGPVENKLLCYGLLELAKDAIRNVVPSPIIKPTINDMKVVN